MDEIFSNCFPPVNRKCYKSAFVKKKSSREQILLTPESLEFKLADQQLGSITELFLARKM